MPITLNPSFQRDSYGKKNKNPCEEYPKRLKCGYTPEWGETEKARKLVEMIVPDLGPKLLETLKAYIG